MLAQEANSVAVCCTLNVSGSCVYLLFCHLEGTSFLGEVLLIK